MKNKNILFIILIALAAFSLAGIGAWFSVFGLTKIFAAGWSTFILFGALEIAKLIVVSFVYRFWKITKWFQRVYLILATIILMAITSMGIYGYLTAAFQKTSSAEEINRSEVDVFKLKKDRFEENRTYYLNEKENINKDISELRQGLSNNKIQYTDTLGNVITTTSINTRRVLQKQLDDAIGRRDNISIKLENVTDSLAFYERKIFEMKSEDETSTELGPLIYLSEVSGVSMNKVINWLTLIIIIVVDPLAVMLIVVFNLLLLHSGFDPFEGTTSYKKLKKEEKKKEEFEEEPKESDEESDESMEFEEKSKEEDNKIKKEPKRDVQVGSSKSDDISKVDTFMFDSFRKIEDLILAKNKENDDFKNNIEEQIKDLKDNINKDEMLNINKQLSDINDKVHKKDEEFKSSVVEQFKNIEDKIRIFDDNMDEIILSKENEDEEFKNEVLSKIDILSEKLMNSSDEEFKEKVERQIKKIVERLKDKSDIELLKDEIYNISNEVKKIKEKKEEPKKEEPKKEEPKKEEPQSDNIKRLGSINKAHFYPRKYDK